MKDQETTHFGYQEVPIHEKAKKVAGVFHSVANQYDLMNDLMSLGAHRLWKRMAIQMLNLRPGHRVLDIAGGTGDLTSLMLPQVGKEGLVILSDINSSMLNNGRDRLINEGHIQHVDYALLNGEMLPFKKNTFDRITVGFGLRNMTFKDKALAEMYRVLKPGGQLLVLEFSHPTNQPLNTLYDFYSFQVLPKLGEWIANDRDSYQYLAESIRKHPDQQTLLNMIKAAGFEDGDFRNILGGVVAIHRGHKY